MKTFDTFEEVPDMAECVKRSIVVHSKQIMEEFRVNTLEGNYKQGKPGDYLIRGVDGELYICDKEIFEKTYDVFYGISGRLQAEVDELTRRIHDLSMFIDTVSRFKKPGDYLRILRDQHRAMLDYRDALLERIDIVTNRGE